MTLDQATNTIWALRDCTFWVLRLKCLDGELGWQVERNVDGLWAVLGEKDIQGALNEG
jgi:hypothetical protein